MEPEHIRDAAVSALEDIKARDIEVLDVRALTSLFDWVIVASADSSRQTRALAHHVQDQARQRGARHAQLEGEASGEWILVDLGAVVVHVMQPATREYYNLSELWGGHAAPRRYPPLGPPIGLWRNEASVSSASF
jgi:ribosome-associated protein